MPQQRFSPSKRKDTMLLKLLQGLFRHPRPPAAAASSRPDELDDLGFYRTLRSGDQNPANLIAHARWLQSRTPLLAAELLQEAARRQPHATLPLICLGELHLELGNHQSAAESFHAALLRDELNSTAWHGLAQARRTQGRDAEAVYAETQAANPSRPARADFCPEACDLALSLVEHARPRAALELAQAACQNMPDDTRALLALATAQAALEQIPQALETIRRGLTLHPDHIGLRILQADCLAAENPVAALEAYLAIIAGNADVPATVLNNAGQLLNQQDRFAEAAGLLRRALLAEPGFQKIRLNLAYALTYLGERTEALALLDELLAKEPAHFEARWYRSHLKLALHDLHAGWQDYRYRFVAAATAMRPMPMRRWDGLALDTGKTLLVTAEQGIGDEIMFAGCLPDLQTRARNILLECDPRLQPLFTRSFPGIRIIPRPAHVGQPPPAADSFIPAGSLPGLFRADLESFRFPRPPYLIADPVRVAEYKHRLMTLGPGLKIGFAWRGGTAGSRRNTRSLELSQLHPLFDLPSCRFVSLQYGDCTAELEGVPVIHWPEAIADLDNFAALISALDLVIAVCSAPAHFCGGLGKPAWILTPLAAEWRYTTLDDHMLWYPDVRLFQQTRADDWGSVISRVTQELRDHPLLGPSNP